MKITLLTGRIFNIQKALGFEIKVVKSKTARKLTLRIDSKAHLPVLTIPKYCSSKQAVEFALSHKDWIERNLAKIPSPKRFADKERFSFFGSEIEICHDSSLKSGSFLQDNILHVSGSEEFCHRRVSDFIKRETQKKLLELSRQKASALERKVNTVYVKDTKSRWGSCSTNGNLSYSWRLALAPEFVIDYLISHEVSHLKHPDHSRNFWNCVKALCPECAKGKAWLKTHGKELYAYE